ncbi:MAG: uracil-DNA glycosylase [Alphaproteobacteria bacterium]|nr:uracil-DNA glycosylase [Alphaproteobacteria bacterium]
MSFTPPSPDCPLCPRLADFRAENRIKFPGRHNAPVPSFGALDSEFLVVGLAPGLKGANFSGRPFTGDYAGELLYGTLLKYGFARGSYQARADDGLELINCRITNAVRCVPPQNKPEPLEIKTCGGFLKKEIAAMPRLRVILSLGLISHKAVLAAFGQKASAHIFGHGAVHEMGGVTLVDSYHCSRYNTQTKRLTAGMFENVFEVIKEKINQNDN